MKRGHVETLLVTVLVGVAALQVARRFGSEPLAALPPIALDSVFPANLLSSERKQSNAIGEACRVAYVIDPYCPACKQLAAKLAGQSDGAASRPLLWISAGNKKETREFASEYGISDTSVRWILRGKREERLPPAQILDRIGVYAVPMRLIISSDNVVRDMRITHRFPEGEILKELCTGDERAEAAS